jgi:hypothetical protein
MDVLKERKKHQFFPSSSPQKSKEHAYSSISQLIAQLKHRGKIILAAKFYTQALGSLLVASYDLQGYGGGI